MGTTLETSPKGFDQDNLGYWPLLCGFLGSLLGSGLATVIRLAGPYHHWALTPALGSLGFLAGFLVGVRLRRRASLGHRIEWVSRATGIALEVGLFLHFAAQALRYRTPDLFFVAASALIVAASFMVPNRHAFLRAMINALMSV